jgi:hypothetical protein
MIPPPLPPGSRIVLQNIRGTIKGGRECIISAIDRSTSLPVTLLCHMTHDPSDSSYSFIPLAILITDIEAAFSRFDLGPETESSLPDLFAASEPLWTEDLSFPDTESLGAAFLRITGDPFIPSQASQSAAVENGRLLLFPPFIVFLPQSILIPSRILRLKGIPDPSPEETPS